MKEHSEHIIGVGFGDGEDVLTIDGRRALHRDLVELYRDLVEALRDEDKVSVAAEELPDDIRQQFDSLRSSVSRSLRPVELDRSAITARFKELLSTSEFRMFEAPRPSGKTGKTRAQRRQEHRDQRGSSKAQQRKSRRGNR